jgi:peptide/nickel transport system permease protein
MISSLARPFRRQMLGAALIVLILMAALLATALAPNDPDDQFSGLLHAPPTSIRVVDAAGAWRAPFVYGWRRVSQIEQRYEVDSSVIIPLQWFRGGRLLTSTDAQTPLLLLGADGYGRDVFARLLAGARMSIAVASLAAFGALVIGVLIGAWAGDAAPPAEAALMGTTHFLLLLPATYVALALRAALPLVLETRQVFWLLVAIFAVLGSPTIATGVRQIIRSERTRDYALAATALGAGRARVLAVHLVPAARGFLLVQLTVLIPAFVMAEATLSYVGLGFPDTAASWGLMLQEATSVRALGDFPWLLSPALVMFLLVFALNLLAGRSATFSQVSARQATDSPSARR